MLIYPDDRVLVAVMNNLEDWQRVQDEHWYRIPVKNAPQPVPHIDWIAFYQTKVFGQDKWAIHYYAHVEGHELLTRRDLIPSQADHKRAGAWYYKLVLDELYHKLPPVISYNWRRITFIMTTGDRFEAAEEINDLFADESPAGHLYVTLKEVGIRAERNIPLKEGGVAYQADLAIPVENNRWLSIMFAEPQNLSPSPNILYFSPDQQPEDCLKVVQQKLAGHSGKPK